MGHPLLRQIAQPVDVFDAVQMHELLTDMEDTMRALNGAGIAAPQIGVSLRVVIFEMQENPRYPHVTPHPVHRADQSGARTARHGNGRRLGGLPVSAGPARLVPRFRRLRYSGLDRDGQGFERTVEGFHARVVQHEVDHLDGLLFPQRIQDLTRFGFEDALAGQMVPMPD